MTPQQLKEKFDKKFGLDGVINIDKHWDEGKIEYYLPNGFKFLVINIYESDDGWNFGGYEEQFQRHWNEFCKM